MRNTYPLPFQVSFWSLILTLFLAFVGPEMYAQSAQRMRALQLIQEGDNNLQMGLFNDAIFSYTNSITTDPTYAEAYMKRASILQRVGRYTEAKRDMEKAKQMSR